MKFRRWRRSASAATRGVCRSRWLLAAACAVALSACTTDGQPTASAMAPRGASVAFESIDGPPAGQFRNGGEPQRRSAVAPARRHVARESRRLSRARLSRAKVAKERTTISSIWDVFDAEDRRVLRISGEQDVKGRQHDAWAAADNVMLQRIARSSMDQLAAFLTSPEVGPDMVERRAGDRRSHHGAARPARIPSPEAAGIFRIFNAQADPVSASPSSRPRRSTRRPVRCRLPRRRPESAALMAYGERNARFGGDQQH